MNKNKAEKSLRWVVNQIPDLTPKTNEEKMLLAIKLYSEAGAEEIKRLEAENAALRERLDKAVELPFDHKYEYFYIEPFFGKIKPSLVDDGAKVVIPMYVYFKFNSVEEAKTWLTKQQTGGKEGKATK